MESDNRNCQESESDDGTSDSTALVCIIETSTLQQYPNVIKFHESKHSEKVVHEQKDKNALEIPTF